MHSPAMNPITRPCRGQAPTPSIPKTSNRSVSSLRPKMMQTIAPISITTTSPMPLLQLSPSSPLVAPSPPPQYQAQAFRPWLQENQIQEVHVLSDAAISSQSRPMEHMELSTSLHIQSGRCNRIPIFFLYCDLCAKFVALCPTDH